MDSIISWMIILIVIAAGAIWIVSRKKSKVVLVVLGSGGHTAEMLRMIKDLPSEQKRIYLMANQDMNSKSKLAKDAGIITIPRSRRVHQSWITTPITTIYATLYCFVIVWKLNPAVVVGNGPGTCVPVFLAAYLYKTLGILKTKLLYIESYSRVSNLSLSGKILYPIADRVVVQWPLLQAKYPKSEYHGRLV